MRRCGLRSSLTHGQMRSLRCSSAPSIWTTWPPNLSAGPPAAPLMPTIGVVGLGLMGSSFAMALKKAQPDVTIVGSDYSSATVRKAMDRGVVTAAGTGLGAIGMAEVGGGAVPILG